MNSHLYSQCHLNSHLYSQCICSHICMHSAIFIHSTICFHMCIIVLIASIDSVICNHNAPIFTTVFTVISAFSAICIHSASLFTSVFTVPFFIHICIHSAIYIHHAICIHISVRIAICVSALQNTFFSCFKYGYSTVKYVYVCSNLHNIHTSTMNSSYSLSYTFRHQPEHVLRKLQSS